jgi:hypothetical protein
MSATVTMEPKATSVAKEAKGSVYCPMCTHTVEAIIIFSARNSRVASGQKCARCGSSLDAGYVMRVDRAA